MLMSHQRSKKFEELKQVLRDELIKMYGEPLPKEALLMTYMLDAAAYVNIIILGRDPDDVIKALRGEEPK